MNRMFFTAIFIAMSSSISLGYSGGSGTPQDPYKIANANDLLALAATAADYNKCFILTADIDMNSQVFTTAIIAKDTSSTSSGYQGTPFTGVFDGNGLKITNFSINGGSNNYLGLFGRIDGYSRVINLGLEDAAINGVPGSATIGALAGLNGGSIFNCYSAVPVSGESGVGGLVGSNSGNITNSYSIGAVSGASYIGGLVGQSSGSIGNSYSIGTVSGTSYVGGLVGTGGSIVNSYFLLGAGPDNGFGEPLTDEQMKQQSSFVGWDFLDETANGTCNYWMMPEDAYPVLSVLNGSIPPELPGSGTTEYPYIITDANDLGTVWFRPAAHYVLAGNINLAGVTWSMAVVPAFYGGFDGNDFSINNLSINGLAFLGLFGTAYPNSQIENLALENSTVSGTGRNVGALVGQLSYGNIENCSSAGSINGTDYCVGGLVGYLYYGNIENCSSNGSVIATSPYIGGLVGFSYYGITKNCSSTANVSSTSRLVGGLVGYNVHGNISDCCSAGTVSGDHYGLGGLAGASEYGTISNCCSVGNVSGSNVGVVGGLVGEVFYGSITNSYSTGNVNFNSASTGYPRYIGGLVGENTDGSISDCYSTGDVNGTAVGYIYSIGGLVGENVDGTITNSYATSTVTGSSGVEASYLGGLVGINAFGGGITNCYSTGAVSATAPTVSGIGGLLGKNSDYGTISGCYFLVTSGPDNGYGDPLTDAQMKQQASFIGWDFTTPVWTIEENIDYPHLWWEENILYVPGRYPTIQSAIDAAIDGEVVCVFPGTYTGPGNRNIDFLGKAITVKSKNGPDTCIIDCQNSGRGFYFRNNEDANSVLNGFTITNGYASRGGGIVCETGPTIIDCNITGNLAAHDGGGIACYSSRAGNGNPTIIGCLIAANSALGSAGGGIYCSSSPKISDCRIIDNTADNSSGGGIYCPESLANCCQEPITNCIIAGNSAKNDGGGIVGYHGLINNCTVTGNSAGQDGGGIADCYGQIKNCSITANSAGFEGGGLVSCYGPITNCIISGNSAGNSGGGTYSCRGPITNCTISSNSAEYDGGGIASGRAGSQIENCSIIGNLAKLNGGGLAGGGGHCDSYITNSIFWGNIAANGPQISLSGDISVSFTDLQGGRDNVFLKPYASLDWGPGNIDTDPCFVESGYWDANGTPADANDDFWVDGDYHLKSAGWRWDIQRKVWTWDDVTSRCIDAGNPGSPLSDELLSIPDDPNNEWGQNLRIDMGAFGGTAEASIPPYDWALLSDITNDGISDLDDLDVLSSLWMNTGEQLYADFNRDAIVDLFDFALLAQNWLAQTSWH